MNQMNLHVPLNPVGAAPNVGVGVGMPMPVAGAIMQQPSPQHPQQMQPAMAQPPQQDKMDNISKVKTLMSSLRESIPMTLKSAAQILHQNHNIDSNSQKGIDAPVPRFDKNLEEFFSLCDQMELHLLLAHQILVGFSAANIINKYYKTLSHKLTEPQDKLKKACIRTAITCIEQQQSAAHYLPSPVHPVRLDSGPSAESTLSYPQYLNTVRLQISYAKDIHDTLVAAAQTEWLKKN